MARSATTSANADRPSSAGPRRASARGAASLAFGAGINVLLRVCAEDLSCATADAGHKGRGEVLADSTL